MLSWREAQHRLSNNRYIVSIRCYSIIRWRSRRRWCSLRLCWIQGSRRFGWPKTDLYNYWKRLTPNHIDKSWKRNAMCSSRSGPSRKHVLPSRAEKIPARVRKERPEIFITRVKHWWIDCSESIWSLWHPHRIAKVRNSRSVKRKHWVQFLDSSDNSMELFVRLDETSCWCS